jgi:hypothetical protein
MAWRLRKSGFAVYDADCGFAECSFDMNITLLIKAVGAINSIT